MLKTLVYSFALFSALTLFQNAHAADYYLFANANYCVSEGTWFSSISDLDNNGLSRWCSENPDNFHSMGEVYNLGTKYNVTIDGEDYGNVPRKEVTAKYIGSNSKFVFVVITDRVTPPPPASPENCDELGLDYDSSDGGSCVSECPNGVLNGICLNGAPVSDPNESGDGTECKPTKDDYSGVFDGKHYCDSNLPEPATCPEGEMAYIQTDDSGSGAFVCGEPISEPGEAEESETETTETTTDQDGNTVTETTDGDGNTTTTTSDGNGNSSTTNNYPGTDSETGEPCTSESVACYPTPDTEKGLCKDGGSLCDDVRDIRDAIDQESDRTEKTGEFNTEQANTEVSQAETDLETGIDSIKSEIGGYFDLALSGGDMVCGPGVDVLGTTIQICPSEMKEELAVIAQIVMLIASLISLMIIFR
jgi:hypothetical protein